MKVERFRSTFQKKILKIEKIVLLHKQGRIPPQKIVQYCHEKNRKKRIVVIDIFLKKVYN